MISFRQFLNESEILRNYTSTDQFRYYKGQIANDFKQLKSDYPYDGGRLYRGLNFSSPKQYLNFRRAIRNGMISSEEITSWSPDLGTAKQFAVSPQVYSISSLSPGSYDPNERVSGFIGVILVIECRSGVGIDVRKSEYASESEVILPPGSYKIVDIIVEKKWRHIVNKLDINQEVIDILNTNRNVDPELMRQLFRYKGGDLYDDVKVKIVSNAVDSFIKKNYINISYVEEPIRKWERNKKEHELLFPDGTYKFNLWGDLGLLNYTVFESIKDIITPRDLNRIRTYMINKINTTTKVVDKKNVMIEYDHAFNQIVTSFDMGINDFKYLAAAYSRAYHRFNQLLRDYNRLQHFDMHEMTKLLQDHMKGPFR